jgi:hypothetical protein
MSITVEGQNEGTEPRPTQEGRGPRRSADRRENDRFIDEQVPTRTIESTDEFRVPCDLIKLGDNSEPEPESEMPVGSIFGRVGAYSVTRADRSIVLQSHRLAKSLTLEVLEEIRAF